MSFSEQSGQIRPVDTFPVPWAAIEEYQKNQGQALSQFVSRNSADLEAVSDIEFVRHERGFWYDRKSYCVHPHTYEQIRSHFGIQKFDIESHSDLVHVAGLLRGETPRVFTLGDGLVILLLIPRAAIWGPQASHCL